MWKGWLGGRGALGELTDRSVVGGALCLSDISCLMHQCADRPASGPESRWAFGKFLNHPPAMEHSTEATPQQSECSE